MGEVDRLAGPEAAALIINRRGESYRSTRVSHWTDRIDRDGFDAPWFAPEDLRERAVLRRSRATVKGEYRVGVTQGIANRDEADGGRSPVGKRSDCVLEAAHRQDIGEGG